MGSYITIDITGPAEEILAVKLKKLPTFDLFEYTEWDRSEIIARVRNTDPSQEDGLLGWTSVFTGEHHIFMSGNDKWSPEETWIWARKFSAKHPTFTVTHRDEWDSRDADEPGSEERVYRAGKLIEAESKVSGEVPMNLDELLAAARKALTTTDPLPPREALKALVAGLS